MNSPATLDEWIANVNARKTRVGIIGLGYVGLPLALLFSEAGFSVLGFDIDPEKVAALNSGRSYIHRITAEQIAKARASGFRATSDFAEANGCDAVLICVPTPLAANHEPDMSFVAGTVEALAPHTRSGQLIVLESTTWPGTTSELVVPALKRLAPTGTELLVAFSPEREDPGNTTTPRRTIPKVIGGIDQHAAQAAAALYGAIFDRTVVVSSTEAAEMTKLLENIYRGVNIALVNELKQLCLAMGIDIWEVIDAAATKPFGFAPFYPGPGIGGHCIPVDPFYLAWRARHFNRPTRFIELAGEVNEAMPAFVVRTIQEALAAKSLQLGSAKILLLGIAYKRDIDDLRESPSLTIFQQLREAGASVAYNDPYFPTVGAGRHYSLKTHSTPLDQVPTFDCVVLLTDHSAYDIPALVAASRIFVDTRNATRGLAATNIIRC
jgi:UDP-N-acetyl-D-glucosamine dehydrogenase